MTQGIGKGSYLDMNGDEFWSDEFFQRKKRDDVAHVIPSGRQDDLVIIMIGSLLGWRPALASETAEAQTIMTATLVAYNAMLDAQSDYALRCQAQAVEAAQARLLQPVVQPITDPTTGLVTNQADVTLDTSQRTAAQATITVATADVMAVVTFRNRYPPPSPT